MKLRPGITGFCTIDDPPLPIVDLKSFRTHCYEAARALGARVLRIDSFEKIDSNFVMAVVELADGPVAVFLNRHFPVIGFAVPPGAGDVSPLPLRFVDCKLLAQEFRATGGYEVLSREELERSLDPNHLQQLLPAEIEQAKYWRPQRVGDVVFNFWD